MVVGCPIGLTLKSSRMESLSKNPRGRERGASLWVVYSFIVKDGQDREGNGEEGGIPVRLCVAEGNKEAPQGTAPIPSSIPHLVSHGTDASTHLLHVPAHGKARQGHTEIGFEWGLVGSNDWLGVG